VTEISVEIQKKNPILPYKWLFWWVFNFRFLREDVKCAKNEVHELLFHVQIVKQVILLFFCSTRDVCLGTFLYKAPKLTF
jgi:hypothetical protein